MNKKSLDEIRNILHTVLSLWLEYLEKLENWKILILDWIR